MRVLLTGGGTAGHVNPALAIADALTARDPDALIEYVGTEKGIESKLVRARGMVLHTIEVYGLKRSLSPSNVKALAKALSAKKACKKLIADFSPDVVIGTGGYVCWPLIAAAASMKVPTVLHEANAEPGFAVKTLQKKADLILVNFESTKEHLKGAKNRVLRVGMPVRKEFYRSEQKRSLAEINGTKEKRNFSILSFGGSLGAMTVNDSITSLAKTVAERYPEVKIEHSCGAREFDRMHKMWADAGLLSHPNLMLSAYIYDMPDKMAKADLVICRSGASTLAELAAAGKASILIPSPNVTGDQQRKNARALSAKGAAIVMEDADAPIKLPETVTALIEEADHVSVKRMEREVRAFAVDSCDELIYEAIVDLIKR